MEDALRAVHNCTERIRKCVLILVLMEDALRENKLKLETVTYFSLNPCSNGRCSASVFSGDLLLEDVNCLNPCSNGRCSARAYEHISNMVSIMS